MPHRTRFVTAVVSALLVPAGVTGAGPATVPTKGSTDIDAAGRAEAIRLLSAGRQADAEGLIFAQARDHPTLKNAYFAAVLVRSRFEVGRADRLFARISRLSPDSVEGRTAKLIEAIDAGDQTDANIHALDQLSIANPNDPLILWMVAVECRQLHKNTAGIERYRHLLKVFNPGPSLVHQTLGNLLLDDGQPAAALEQYDAAIALEPAAWDYNCRANALRELNRPADAAAAYQKAVDLDPDYEFAWRNWASLCASQGDFKGAAEKVAKADAIESRGR